MEHNQNKLASVAECDSATGTSLTRGYRRAARIGPGGEHGDADYCRRLADEELEIVQAREARRAAREEAERARFFSDEK